MYRDPNLYDRFQLKRVFVCVIQTDLGGFVQALTNDEMLTMAHFSFEKCLGLLGPVSGSALFLLSLPAADNVHNSRRFNARGASAVHVSNVLTESSHPSLARPVTGNLCSS